MATTATPYAQFLNDVLSGVHNVTTDTTKVALLSSAYTVHTDTDATYANVSGSEITGTGYTAGGNTLSGKSITYDSTAKTATLAAAMTTWVSLSATFRYAVIYKSTGTASTSSLMGLIDFGADQSYSAQALELSFPSGVITVGVLS